MMQENNSTHWILGGALLLIGLFVIIALVLTRQQAGTITLDVTNVAPTVNTVKICANPSTNTCTAVTSINTSVNADTLYDVYAIVHDDNGTADVPDANVSATLYRTDTTITACDTPGEADGNSCIPATVAVQDGADLNATDQRFKISGIPVKYWADPTSATADDFAATDWSIRVDAKDTGNLTGFAEITKELEELTALIVPPTIDLGSGGSARANGFASGTTTNFDATFTQAGNTDADAQIKLDNANLTCTTLGSIPAGAIKWESAFGASDVAYASMTKTLTTSFADIDLKDNAGNSQAAIRRRVTEGVAPAASASFGISVPYGVSGTCSSASTITAVKQSVTGAGG